MSSLRQMKPEDLFDFADCNFDPLTETYGISFYLEYLSRWPHLCHVMVSHDGRIEGYILGKVESSPRGNQPTTVPYDPKKNKNFHYLPWHAHITALTVAPRARRLGHARRMTEVLEQIADDENAWFVDLFVRADNVMAMDLYKSMGYTVFRTIKNYYSDGQDAYDMRKPMARDKERLHIRENGEKHEVDPDFVW